MNLFEAFWRSIFPEFCLACYNTLVRGEKLLCLDCKFELPHTDYTTDKENPLFLRFSPHIDLHNAFALWYFNKEGIVQTLLHNLKYYNHPEISHYAGISLGENLKKHNFQSQIDSVIPVPLHTSRKRQRGYNQSAGFAQGIAEILEIKWSDDWIIRNKATQTQTKKNQEERKKNVDGIFLVKDFTHIKDKNVLVVDDIITTGATLLSLMHTLREAGAKNLFVACIAMAVQN
jgi:ComF family protein